MGSNYPPPRFGSNKVILLMTMKMMLKKKNRSHRCDINRPGPRHGHKYAKYKMCLSIMIAICNKLHLSNIWSLIYEKVEQKWGFVEKECCLHACRFCCYLTRVKARKISWKIWETRKLFAILHLASYDNYMLFCTHVRVDKHVVIAWCQVQHYK